MTDATVQSRSEVASDGVRVAIIVDPAMPVDARSATAPVPPQPASEIAALLKRTTVNRDRTALLARLTTVDASNARSAVTRSRRVFVPGQRGGAATRPRLGKTDRPTR